LITQRKINWELEQIGLCLELIFQHKFIFSMILIGLSKNLIQLLKMSWSQLALSLLVLIASFAIWTMPVSATINDDRFEGSVYVLFGGNGSLVPPRMDLPTSLKREKPAILVFCVDDSSDCKQFSIEVTRLQEFYGRAASIIPVSVDSFIDQDKYSPSEPAYYYHGLVPETVILDQKGKVVYDGTGQVAYEEMDDVLREVFDLLPRSESTVLKRRSFNEFNAGMTKD
jgi:hypothetical protein